jgi:predicted dehydrogenase
MAGGAVLVLPVARGLADPSHGVSVAFVGPPVALAELQDTCARVPGFHIASAGDLAVDAVCIAAPEPAGVRMAVAACAAGKDVYVAALRLPISLSEAEEIAAAARWHGRVVQMGGTQRSGVVFRGVRTIVKSGQLGEVGYCRIANLDSLDLVHFVFDDEAPLSARVQRAPSGTLATYRYPRTVVSCEPGSVGTSFHGSQATLLVDRNGCRIFGQDGLQASIADTGDDELAGHWRDWLECIRTRRAPVAAIGKAVTVARAQALALA